MRKRILCLLAALMLLVPAIPAAAQEMPEGTENFSYTFDGANIDDGSSMTTDANGKTKVIVLFKVGCGHCESVLEGIANSDWLKDEELADVYALAMDRGILDKTTYQEVNINADNVKDFRATYCSAANGRIQFGIHSRVISAMDRYAGAANLKDSQGYFTTPIIAIVDAENKLRDITSGSTDVVSTMKAKLEAIKTGNTQDPDPDNPNNPGTPDDPSDPDTPENPGTPDDPNDPDTPNNPGSPDDPSNPDNPSNPDDTQKPDQPEQPEQPVTEESSNDQPACSHRVESVLMSGSTDTTDAVVASKCVKCGAVLGYEKVANSAYHTFLKETADAIANAKEATVVIDAKMWVSFDKSVFEAIKSRPDVAVTVNYSYEGQKYVLQIPAGVNVDSLMDENGFGGFRYIEKVLNTSK